MGTNCAPLVADFILFCYERDLMMSFSDDKQADMIYALNTTPGYLDDILNINNVYFDNMVSLIYHSELQLNTTNLLIPKPRLWTCIYTFLIIVVLPKFTINVIIFILKLSI